MGSSTWAKDAVERIVWTVVELVVTAALAAFTNVIRGADVVTVDTLIAAVSAAYAAAVTALKAWFAKMVEGTISPASMAKAA
jgi:hypothetical protein